MSFVKSDLKFRICTKRWIIWGRSGSVRVISSRVTVRLWFPGRAEPFREVRKVRNSGPVRGSGIPNQTLTQPTKRSNPDQPYIYPTFCVDSESESRFHVTCWNHELDGHLGVSSPSANLWGRPGPTKPSQNSDLPSNSVPENRNLGPDHYHGPRKRSTGYKRDVADALSRTVHSFDASKRS